MEGSKEGAAEKPVHLKFRVLHLCQGGILFFLQLHNFQLVCASKLPGSQLYFVNKILDFF